MKTTYEVWGFGYDEDYSPIEDEVCYAIFLDKFLACEYAEACEHKLANAPRTIIRVEECVTDADGNNECIDIWYEREM